MRRKLNEFANTSRALHTIVILGFVIAFMVSILSCQDFYIGKTEAELSQEMFEVDSLMRTIHLQMDSVETDFNRLYIDAQRINNGSN